MHQFVTICNLFILHLNSFIGLTTCTGSFNPFSDDELFAINWAGPSDLRPKTSRFQFLTSRWTFLAFQTSRFDLLISRSHTPGDIEIISVQTDVNERYHCIIPESQASIDATKKATYNGATPEELMQSLFTQSACSYRIESYWTYELCHGKHVKQYHENRELTPEKAKTQEYYLGKIEAKKTAGTSKEGKEDLDEDEIDDDIDIDDTTAKTKGSHSEDPIEKKPEVEIKNVRIDGLDLPYFPVEMDSGSECDLTGQPRKSHIMYICQPNGRGEIFQLKETSSCEYDIIVLTAILCSHPAFKPKDPPVSKINCHAADGSPFQPTRLTYLQNEQGIVLEPEGSDNYDLENIEIKVAPVPPKKHPVPPKTSTPKATTPAPNTKIGIEADKSLLRDFLNGDYCIHGGGGWWRHEFCYNKHAKQYHEDQTGTTDIYLGHWDKSKHLAWLEENPIKKPKPPGHRKHISLFYTGGDICDVTNKPRHVEVKLKCLKKTDQPHAVSIYLVEPDPCTYVLGVESPLFCDILDKADGHGLLDHIEV